MLSNDYSVEDEHYFGDSEGNDEGNGEGDDHSDCTSIASEAQTIFHHESSFREILHPSKHSSSPAFCDSQPKNVLILAHKPECLARAAVTANQRARVTVADVVERPSTLDLGVEYIKIESNGALEIFAEKHQYDMVFIVGFMRWLAGDIPGFFKRCFHLLKPDGCMEVSEPGIKFYDSSGAQHSNSTLRKWTDLMFGNNFRADTSHELPLYLQDAGFTVAQLEPLRVPVTGGSEVSFEDVGMLNLIRLETEDLPRIAQLHSIPLDQTSAGLENEGATQERRLQILKEVKGAITDVMNSALSQSEPAIFQRVIVFIARKPKQVDTVHGLDVCEDGWMGGLGFLEG